MKTVSKPSLELIWNAAIGEEALLMVRSNIVLGEVRAYWQGMTGVDRQTVSET